MPRSLSVWLLNIIFARISSCKSSHSLIPHLKSKGLIPNLQHSRFIDNQYHVIHPEPSTEAAYFTLAVTHNILLDDEQGASWQPDLVANGCMASELSVLLFLVC